MHHVVKHFLLSAPTLGSERSRVGKSSPVCPTGQSENVPPMSNAPLREEVPQLCASPCTPAPPKVHVCANGGQHWLAPLGLPLPLLNRGLRCFVFGRALSCSSTSFVITRCTCLTLLLVFVPTTKNNTPVGQARLRLKKKKTMRPTATRKNDSQNVFTFAVSCETLGELHSVPQFFLRFAATATQSKWQR